MELTRRYLFNGSAAAYGGRFVRPDDVVLASSGGSALAITGGRSVWRDRYIKLGRSFRIRSAETSAEGLVDSLRDAVRVTHRQLSAEALTATTRVSALRRCTRASRLAPRRPRRCAKPSARSCTGAYPKPNYWAPFQLFTDRDLTPQVTWVVVPTVG